MRVQLFCVRLRATEPTRGADPARREHRRACQAASGVAGEGARAARVALALVRTCPTTPASFAQVRDRRHEDERKALRKQMSLEHVRVATPPRAASTRPLSLTDASARARPG